MVHQGALGDFLLALPVLEGLYLSYPHLRIDFWAKRAHVDLIAGRPYAGRGHSIDSPELVPFFHEDLWQKAEVPDSFLRCDAALVFGQATSRLMVRRLRERAHCAVHWVRSFPEAACDAPQSVSHFLVEQVRRLGWCVRETIPRLEIAEVERFEARKWMIERGWDRKQKPVLIHLGSGGRKKIWPLARWWAVLRWFREAHPWPLILTLGPADEELADFALAAQKEMGAHLVGELSLMRLAAFLAESRFYLGNDSGVSHLAAAVGIPVGLIFGPTDPRIWAPLGDNVHVVTSQWEASQVFAWSVRSEGQAPEPDVRRMIESLVDGTLA